MTDQEVQRLQDKLAKADELVRAAQTRELEIKEQLAEAERSKRLADATIEKIQLELDGWLQDERYEVKFKRVNQEVANLQTVSANLRRSLKSRSEKLRAAEEHIALLTSQVAVALDAEGLEY